LDRHRLNLQCRKVSSSLRPSLPSPFPGTSQLTKVWTTTYIPPHLKRRLISAATPTTPPSTIEHLVLIDLLGGVGAPRPHVRSYFPDTAWLFDMLVSAEKCLCDTPRPRRARQRFLLHAQWQGCQLGIHGRRPSTVFMSRCERAAHHRCIIAGPFPCVWHTLGVSICHPPIIHCALIIVGTSNSPSGGASCMHPAPRSPSSDSLVVAR